MSKYIHNTAKTCRAFYTEEKIRNMKNNIKKYPWAKNERDSVIEKAEEYLSYGVERLLLYVTQQNLPRSFAVNQINGCPICGKNIDKFGGFPYTADPLNNPFKIECPSCKSVFPSNDFDSYYKSGLDENGRFHYDKADKKYLVNELYPDKPSNWCVDDGFGWVDPEGIKTKSFGKVFDREKGMVRKETTIGDNRYTFIAYFNHWYVWLHNFKGHGDKGFVTSAISVFRDAYLYTGKKKYANAGLLLLNRVAEFYPEYDACEYKWEDNFRHSGGAWGKIIGSIWERHVVDNLMKAYDAFFPAIDEDALNIITSQKIYKNNSSVPKSVKDIKENIENNLLRQILPEVKNHRIRGNVGIHQSSIALAALILQNKSYFEKCIDYILSTTDSHLWGPGNILRIITNETDHDGCGNETSVNYNGIWLNGIHSIAEILKGTSQDLYNNPKFLKMFRLNIPYLIADRYSLNIGDTNKAGNPVTVIHERPLLSHFELTGDVKSAQLLDAASRFKKDNVKGAESGNLDIFTDFETLKRNISNIIQQHGEYRSKSENFSGFGLSKIEIRKKDLEPKSVWMYYGRNTGHGHRDTLMLGIFAYGVFVNPDCGYPVRADGNPMTKHWNKNTISHDTVTVDNASGKDHLVGIPKHFHTSKYVSVTDVKAPRIYEQTTHYRRTAVTVALDDDFYIVDLFRVAGGDDHKYVFHGGEGDATAKNLKLVKQKGGTLAGEDVKYASPEYDKSKKDGLNYLYDVKRDTNVKSPFTVDWKIKDTWGVWDTKREVHLKIDMLSQTCEAILAKGKPPQNKPGNPKEYTYLIANNKGKDIKSAFSSVIETYENNSGILKAKLLNVKAKDGSDDCFNARAIKVSMKNGRTDYILNSIDNKTYIVDGNIEFNGFLTVISEKDGKIIYTYSNDTGYCKFKNKLIVSENPSVTGKVVDFTKEMSLDNSIIVKLDRDILPEVLKGTYVDIETDQIRNGFYKILSVEAMKDNLYKLNVGDTIFIREFKDATDFEKGYVYNIEKGASLKIPITNFSKIK